MNKLYLKPYGGLSNRVLTMASAMAFANDFNKELVVLWDRHIELNADFGDVFDCAPFHITEFNKVRFPSVKLLFDKFPVRKNPIFYIRKRLSPLPYQQAYFADFFYRLAPSVPQPDLDEFYKNIYSGFKEHLNARPPEKNVFISSCLSFWDAGKSLKEIKPAADILKEADDFSKNLPAYTIGIHIRRGDHKLAREKSSIEQFTEVMNQEIAARPEAGFFLATDSQDVETQLLHTFGDKIITRKKSFDRQSVDGIKDAFVDLTLLSRAKKIYGSFWSSFSYLAAKLGEIPLEIIVKES